MLIDENDAEYSVRRQSSVLGLNRSSWYYEPVPISERDQMLMNLIG